MRGSTLSLRTVMFVALALALVVCVLNMLSGGSPGDTGRVLDGQAKIIGNYVDEAIRSGELVVFAGHTVGPSSIR